MKKNLRIASAAAAALLAVAPVAASAVNPANADVTFDNTAKPAPSTSSTKVAITVALGDLSKDVTDVTNNATVSATVKDNNNVAAVNGYHVLIFKDNNGALGDQVTSGKLDSGDYHVVVTNLTVNGLVANTSYSAQDGSFGTFTAASGSTPASFTKSNSLTGNKFAGEGSNGVDFEESFHVNKATDTNAIGNPYFKTLNTAAGVPANTAVSSAAITLDPSQANIDNVVSALKSDFALASSATGSNAAVPNKVDFKKDVETSLSGASITPDKDGKFSVPANGFVVTLNGSLNNNKTTTLPVTVSFSQSKNANDSYPQFTNWPGKASSDTTTKSGTDNTISIPANTDWENVKLNGKLDTNAIKRAFTAQINSTDTDNLQVSVDSSKVNTAVAGTYPVTVSATNPAGHKSSITFNVTVGDKDAKYQVAKQDGTVYSINGNNVSATSDSVKNGDNVATYGSPVTVNGKTYVRINGKDSNQFVETSIFTKPAEEKTVSETVMYKSAVYDENGKSTDKHIKGYTDTDFAAGKDGKAEEVTIDGHSFLKLAGNKGYVRTRNVRGSKMTLKKNAYVYKSNGRRANKKLLKKGSTITVFGGQYRAIRHYRKNAVRIGHNRYVKVVNVNYKLAD